MLGRGYPLNALRAFEAAGRRLSFAKAGEELHVTAGAVSHQIKGLEEFLGVRLFHRLPQRVLLTEAGQTFLTDLSDCFARVDRAVERVSRGEASGALTVSVAPAFAAKWLAPRLRKFAAANPEIDLRISASLRPVDFKQDSFDAAIRLGRGKYPGLVSVMLFDETVTPMCSPRLIEGGPELRTPDDLKRHVLLHDDSLDFDAAAPHWADWLKAAGARDVDAARGPHFSHPDHSLQAAIDGGGVVLGWRFLATDDLEAGRVIAPFDLELPLGFGFYLVYPEGHAERPKVAALQQWLLEELAQN